MLDEADQMLDMGFIAPIRKIVASCRSAAPEPVLLGHHAARDRRAWPPRCCAIPCGRGDARRHDRRPRGQRVIHVEPAASKRALLVELFADPAMKRTLVFTRTKRGADKVARHLEAAGILVAAIHGNKSQRQRERALRGVQATAASAA